MGRSAGLNLRVVIRPAIHSLFLALLVPACGDDAAPGRVGPTPPPPPPPAPATLEIQPNRADLSTIAPGNTLQLIAIARDDTGSIMGITDTVRFSSSAPAIARVSSTGVLTAGTPGTAVITATLSVAGITRTASMTASVFGPGEVEFAEMAGVYDLTALITGSDPVWGIEDGTRQVAVLTIQHSGDTPGFTGAFTDFRAIEPDGDSYPGNPGFLTGSIYRDGRVVIELFFEGSQSSYWYGEGLLASGRIAGRFGAGGHISGSFTAERRPAE